MPDAAFIELLNDHCTETINRYHSEYPDGPPLSTSPIPDLDAPTASTADVHEAFTALADIYDDLLAVDSTSYRDTWRDHLVYDCSRRERLALLASDLPTSLTLVFIGGRYVPSTGHIGVNPGQQPMPAAVATLASELCHAYQHRFDSPTWDHPYLWEGFEQAASVRALSRLAERADDVAIPIDTAALATLAAHQRAQTLLEGVLAWGTRRGGITPATVQELGVTDDELAELQAEWWWRPLGQIKPRYRWSAVAFLPEYALFGALLFVSEADGVPDTYARAFAGNHPWTDRIDAIQAMTPSWLWRLYDGIR